MEQNLQLRMTQKLAMTAKLQQAIHLLQLSAQDLCAEVEKEYQENPALELEDESSVCAETGSDRYSFEELQALSAYLGGDGPRLSAGESADAPGIFRAAPQTLEEALEEQARWFFNEPEDLRVARYLIGAIDENGYLCAPLSELAASLGIAETKAAEVLAAVQTFDPSGVGARDLRECLAIQARQQGVYTPLVAALIAAHLDEIAKARYKSVAEAEGCSPSDVQAAADLIRRLHPKPGSIYGDASPGYIVPDVTVRKIGDNYVVLVNDCGLPRLKISAACKSVSQLDKAAKKYIESKVNAAVWLIRSIEQRRATLLRVMTNIVEMQRAFFDQGPAHLRPLRMQTVADNIGVHESTVSRVIANKYAETPHGVLRLRNFFTANLKDGGEELVAGQVKAQLKRLIEAEDPHAPLSDQHLSERLKAAGMGISRRTVVKYREQLGYPSSLKRKRY